MESKDFERVDLSHFKWFNEPTEWNIKNNKLWVKTKCKTDFWQGTWYNFYYNTGHVYGLDLKDDFSMSTAVFYFHVLVTTAVRNGIPVTTRDEERIRVRRKNMQDTTRVVECAEAEPPTESAGLPGTPEPVGTVKAAGMCVKADFQFLYDQAGLMIYIDEKHWLKAGMEFNDGQPMIGSVLTNEVSDWATGVYTGNPGKFWLRLTKVGNVVCVKYSRDSENWILLRLCPFPVSSSCFVGPMFCSPQSGNLEVEFSELTVTTPGKDILHSN